MKKLFLLLCLLILLLPAKAQNCSQNLQDALRSYLNGQFNEISSKLEDCINQLPREEKSEALKLLTDTYLVLRESETADNYMQQLLTHDPDFKTRESDLVEFKNLYDSYKIVSKYAFGLTIGPMRPDYKILKHQSYSGAAQQPDDYIESIGFHLGITGEILLMKNFYLNLKVFYDKRGFEQEEIILGFQSVKSQEKEYRLNIPLQLKYVFQSRIFQPFLSAGYSYHYLIKATGDLEHLGIEPEFPGVSIAIPYSEDNYDLTPLRKRSTLNWVVGAGTQVRLPRGFLLEVGLTYEGGLYNVIEEDMRFSDPVLLDNFSYVPDDYKADAWILSFSIMKNFSKPIKK